MRVDDYEFYGRMCLGFGILILLIGIALIAFTTTWSTTYLGITHIDSPYLVDGIAIVIIGIILLVLRLILFREYRFRMTAQPPPP